MGENEVRHHGIEYGIRKGKPGNRSCHHEGQSIFPRKAEHARGRVERRNERSRACGPQCQECGHPSSGAYVERPRPQWQPQHGDQIPRWRGEDMGGDEAIEGFRNRVIGCQQLTQTSKVSIPMTLEPSFRSS